MHPNAHVFHCQTQLRPMTSPASNNIVLVLKGPADCNGGEGLNVTPVGQAGHDQVDMDIQLNQLSFKKMQST